MIDIENLARLARIAIPEGEREALRRDLESILEYVSALGDAVERREGDAQSDALRNVLRADSAPHEPGVHTEDLLAAAPRREGSSIAVKQIL